VAGVVGRLSLLGTFEDVGLAARLIKRHSRADLVGGVCLDDLGQVVLVDPRLEPHPAARLCRSRRGGGRGFE